MDFLNTAEKRDRRMVHIPMGRFGEAIEQAKAALFRASPKTAFLVKNC
jgi:NAD(P)-dependent dehydrogenase (short-subunit alcohol dehydrogenase family)